MDLRKPPKHRQHDITEQGGKRHSPYRTASAPTVRFAVAAERHRNLIRQIGTDDKRIEIHGRPNDRHIFRRPFLRRYGPFFRRTDTGGRSARRLRKKRHGTPFADTRRRTDEKRQVPRLSPYRQTSPKTRKKMFCEPCARLAEHFLSEVKVSPCVSRNDPIRTADRPLRPHRTRAPRLRARKRPAAAVRPKPEPAAARPCGRCAMPVLR